MQNELKGDVTCTCFTTHKSNLSCNKSGCYTLWKVVAKCRSIKLFIFLNWKPNSLCWYSSENESCLQQVEAICYSREAVSLWVFLLVRFRYWITLERFWIKPQLSQKVLLPDWATRIQNLVVLMKFLVAARKQAAFNVEPWIPVRIWTYDLLRIKRESYPLILIQCLWLS